MRRRASTLVDAIELLQTRTLVKGLEFQLATQGTWTIPARGKQTPIRLALMVTNRSDKVQAVNLLDTLRVVVQDRSGQPLPFRRYKNSLVTAFHTPPLAKNASFRVGYLNAKLVWAFDQLTLQGADGSGGTWYLPGLHAGSYSLSIHYQNRQLMPPQGPVSFWVGEAQTRPRPVTLMP